MSFLSGLSNIFHNIGHVLSFGGDNGGGDEQKRRQQQAASMLYAPRPAAFPQQTSAPQPQQASQQPQAPFLNLTPLQKASGPTPGPYGGANKIDAASLVKAKQFAEANPVPQGTDYNPAAEARATLAAPASTALSVPQSISNLFDLLSPGRGTNRVTKYLDNAQTGLKKFVGNNAGAQQTFGLGQTATGPLTLLGPGEVGALAKAAKVADAVKPVTGFFSDIPVLSKAVQDGRITSQEADQATKIAPGVHSVNPDYAAAAVPPEPVVPPEAPIAAATPVEPLAPMATPVEAPTVAQLSSDAARPAGDIQKAIEEAHNAGDNAKVAQLVETLPEDMKAPMRSALGIPEPTVTAPVEAAPVKPLKTTATAPNAPGIRAAAQKKLDSLAGKFGSPTTHDVLSNKELLDAGKAHADTLNDAQLVNRYATGFSPTDAADIAKGHAALDRLNKIAKADPTNKDVAKAIDNIIAGSEQSFSEGGRKVNYAQAFYDGLKGPAKTNYLIRQIDKVREEANMPLLRDDEQRMSDATAKVQSHVDAEEATKGKIATLEQRAEELKAESEKASAEGKQVPKSNTKEGHIIQAAIEDHKLALNKNTAELGKYYDIVAPPKLSKGAQAGDLGRSLMLSSIAGRGNDIATTAINAGHQLLQKTVEATVGKVANRISGKPGKVIDTGPSITAIGRGMKYGLKKSVQRFKGNVAPGDAVGLLRKADATSGKGQLLSRSNGKAFSKVVAPIHRIVRSGTEVATDLSEGIKTAHIQQLATQQGQRLGLTGENLKGWAAAQSASPSRQLVESGNRLRDEVNNMQDNGLSKALDEGAKALGHIPYVGEQFRNMVLPFTRWTGGAIHNAVTDKNVVANLGQLIKAGYRKDQQGMITAVSKLAVNGVGSIGAGYTLAKAGLLTHENAQGYNDDGVYLHVGGRYIPAGFLGFFAPGIIMGSAAHDVMSDPNNKDNMVKKIAEMTGKTLANSYHALGGESLTGESNVVLQALLNPKNNGGAAGVGATVGGQVTGQYIPALTGDINAILNNGILGIKGSDALNPTHEAALTKVEKGANGVTTKTGKVSTAKDVPRSVENQLLNKIPVVSQKALPRNTGVAANDEFDRLTRGDRDTGAELKAKADAKTLADKQADFAKRGVPDPTITYKQGDSFGQAVENRIENKKYDQAVEGLQAQLALVKSQPDVTTTKTDPIEKQIKTIQVLKAGSYEPTVRDGYKHTTLAEWRAMGDPTSANYDKKTYEELYAFDKAMAAAGVSASTKDGNTPKYSLKDTSKSSGRAAASAAKERITSNTLGSTPSFATIDLSNLAPRKISSSVRIPTIQQVQPRDLIKKRSISVSRTR